MPQQKKCLNVLWKLVMAETVSMKRIIIFLGLLSVLFLSGCSFGRPEGPTKRIPLNLIQPNPMKLRPVSFLVIHKDNAQATFKKLEEQGLQPVVLALTGADYKSLAVNMNEIKNYIRLQRKIIILYKDYYEGQEE